ncbi:MAG: polysaccharide deacetylase family protein [Fibrobacter sp.]|nr:polysaccharide deacetylase family protein [Fibrobacter sp.]
MDYKKLTFATVFAMGASMIYAQNAEIATWSGFRKGATSFTFDDSAPSHVSDAGPLFDKYNYKATFNLIVSAGWNTPDWNGFQKMADTGHEMASHSDSHPGNGAMPNSEIASSKSHINDKINQKYGCITLAYPNCNVPDERQVLQNYIAGRVCNASWAQIPSDVMSKDGPSNWAKVPAAMTGAENSIKSTNDFTGLMQNAINSNGWVMFLTHGFQGKNNGGASYSPTDISAIEGALKWAQQNDKDIWVAPFRNVAMYIKERKASKIEPQDGGSANSMAFELKHSIADNISKYDYPLSIKVKTDWSKVEVTQDGAKLESKVDGGYVYFDAVPNAGKIVVTNANAAPEPESSSSSEVTDNSSSSDVGCDALIPGCGYEGPGMEIAPSIPNNFALSVYKSSDNYIVVGGAQGMSITVFNSLGHKLRTTRGLGAEQKVYTGAKGIYIVKVGGKTMKVRL